MSTNLWNQILGSLTLLAMINAVVSEQSPVLASDPSSLCYAEGRAFQCMPPFTNIVENVDVVASSTCGQKPEKICRSWVDNDGVQQSTCDSCDATNHKTKHHPSYLTDRHISNNQTCWISGPVTSDNTQSTVNLTLSLHKRFEVYYISLQPCGTIPDAIAIYKSSDFGKTWRPWQYFSRDCYRAFRMPTSNEHNTQITTANIQEVLCVDLKPFRKYKDGQSDSVIAFSTTIGRPSTQPWSPALIDWMTMTDLRISLIRFPSRRQREAPGLGLDYPDNAPNDPAAETPVYFAFSDLAVGGRCKCNGHGSRCIKRPDGKLGCDCQHNTEGDDCEFCKAYYYDRPWARATIKSPNVCKRCDCNLHSNRCKFSKEMYLLSGRTSGGLCDGCRHNTAGRRCHYCQDGYFRDWTKPLSHDLVCLKCRCHPIGSVNRQYCDKKTGQCQCKTGVAGLTCDRCMEGYRQTRSPLKPCALEQNLQRPRKPIPDQLLDYSPNNMAQSPDPKCKQCLGSQTKRLRFKKFCRTHAVFQATIQSREIHGEFIRFEMKVLNVWRHDKKAWAMLPSTATYMVYPIWIHFDNLRCSCPRLELGTTYLIITKAKPYNFRGREELLLTAKSVALPWQESWKRRLSKFKRREKRGKCKRFSRRAKKIRRMNRNKDLPSENRKEKYPSYVNYDKNYPKYPPRYPMYNGNYAPNDYGYYGSIKK